MAPEAGRQRGRSVERSGHLKQGGAMRLEWRSEAGADTRSRKRPGGFPEEARGGSRCAEALEISGGERPHPSVLLGEVHGLAEVGVGGWNARDRP